MPSRGRRHRSHRLSPEVLLLWWLRPLVEQLSAAPLCFRWYCGVPLSSAREKPGFVVQVNPLRVFQHADAHQNFPFAGSVDLMFPRFPPSPPLHGGGPREGARWRRWPAFVCIPKARPGTALPWERGAAGYHGEPGVYDRRD